MRTTHFVVLAQCAGALLSSSSTAGKIRAFSSAQQQHATDDVARPVVTSDMRRLELPYDEDCEALLRSWLARAEQASATHDEAGYHFKSLHRRYELPPILLNLGLAPASLLLGNVHLDAIDSALGGSVSLGTLVSSLLTLVAGILAGIGSFNDAKTKSNKHFDIAARYFDIVTDIETELVKPRAFRVPADVFLAKTQQQIDSANARAPVVPKSLLAPSSSSGDDHKSPKVQVTAVSSGGGPSPLLQQEPLLSS
eukprot:CAMPEP_0198656504 /NCGR_PEP_ID=MMETSP1467-20131203/9902_1 /TAXON_ID=1462469 /ORGANISM="unid. sp., Strain CCMP2135" /LENGTH=252 /DNA_ID=CAMNT_0044392545 /DNA_START=57 /DNA_END=815 /DNA_ORIENTATION=+